MKELFNEQRIIPAARNQKDIEKIVTYKEYEYMVMLETHISQLKPLIKFVQSAEKKVLLHADLVNGLKNDEYGVDFLCQEMNPDGVISTRGNVILKVKQHHILAIQRLFLIDTSAFVKGMALLQKVRPDAIELLPGIVPEQIARVRAKTNIPVIAGGLIERKEQIDGVLSHGATAITTSERSLW